MAAYSPLGLGDLPLNQATICGALSRDAPMIGTDAGTGDGPVGLDGVQTFVVACPKDVTMYRDAIKTVGYEGRLVVKDLIELVHESLPG